MNPRDTMTLGAIVTSILTMSAFLAGVFLAYWYKNQSAIELFTGAIIANGTTAVSFWLGSSAGSQKKDQRLADQAAVAAQAQLPQPDAAASR